MGISIRFRKVSSGKFSAFLDIYHKGKRNLEHTEMLVTQDYSKPLLDKAGNPKLNEKGQPMLVPVTENGTPMHAEDGGTVWCEKQLEDFSEVPRELELAVEMAKATFCHVGNGVLPSRNDAALNAAYHAVR